ncbi:hypothetical protein FXO38_26367 [Capsicum annuum]|nr:hypothetical protein FXO38_26367 [Capsicum annuum]KAF3645211.1 hypothetical protein FXO37_21096 [Capsicum annuum]
MLPVHDKNLLWKACLMMQMSSSGNEDDFISKKVFDKLHNENAKLVDNNIGEAHISYSQFSFLDEVLRSIKLDFIKSNLKVEDESMNTGGAAEMTVTTSAEDESKNNEYDAEKIVDTSEDYQVEMNENKSPKDDLKAKHHWILAIISFNDKCIYVYDSLSSAGHDAEVFVEVEKLAEAIPICLVACKFYEKKDIDITNHPNYKSYDKMDLFDVYVVEDLPQQPSGSLDCGLSMVKYAECLTFGNLVSPVDFDPDLIRMRYASIL